MSIEIKTPAQIAVMREAGLVVARTLRVLAAAVRPGITTAELDAIAEAEIRGAGATPSFKGYHGYPATICTSVNEEIVHGIPSPRRSLADGDIISIDCGGQDAQGARDHEPGLAHHRDLLRGLDLDTHASATRPHIPGHFQRTNGRRAAMARLVTSSTGPVASMPIRMFSSA